MMRGYYTCNHMNVMFHQNSEGSVDDNLLDDLKDSHVHVVLRVYFSITVQVAPHI